MFRYRGDVDQSVFACKVFIDQNGDGAWNEDDDTYYWVFDVNQQWCDAQSNAAQIHST